ncbi:Polycomb protein Scm [Stylophora pistillata]|uniref:Polycomb protein Scm n=1 Tax=Stylophora pistillata TaxID=50429 RepID=A0A2B4SN11_STYPI|nr:Polycomb protein Scm [Stylophora pistillata]
MDVRAICVMADGRRQQANGRIRWNVRMNNDLLECKKRALERVKSDNAPRLNNGRKMGYMQMMKELWEEKGYGDFALTSQNQRDQAARLEKTFGSVAESLSAGIGGSERRKEGESVCEELGQYKAREFDTRIKEKPTKRDLDNINQALPELMRQQKVLPTDNPFTYLWIASCVLYSVVIAFLLYKGWKKKGPKRPSAGESKQQKRRRLYVEKVCEIRKQISIAKAEVDRLKENRKLTKRGRRNREILHKECRTLSIASLVGYIEKKKSSLRKLKKGFVRGNKLEEARLINQQFKDDTSRVYAGMRRVLANDQESERPKYVDPGKRDEQIEEKVFVNIEEASSFWKELWEGSGTGNGSAEWLHDLRAIIHDRVPPSVEEAWDIVTTIREKCANWRDYLFKCLSGAKTFSVEFLQQLQSQSYNRFQKGMKVEVADRKNMYSMCVATIVDVIGDRLRMRYDGLDDDVAEDFWCHYQSAEIHPIGWSSLVGHTLQPPIGWKHSLSKWNEFLADDLANSLDAPQEFFVQDSTGTAPGVHQFKVDYTQEAFSWPEYLAKTGGIEAPPQLFRQEQRGENNFKIGTKLEAVDLREPALICPATITDLKGPLLRIHFDGWDDSYDQLVDKDSLDIFPVSYCTSVDHPLQPPGPMPDKFVERYGPVTDVSRQSAPRPLSRPVKRRASADDDGQKKKAKSLYPQEEVYLNKRCYPGPLLSRDLVRSLPDAVRGSVVGPEKHNIMRLCMQHLVSASINPKQVLELFSREFYQSKKNREFQLGGTVCIETKSKNGKRLMRRVRVVNKAEHLQPYLQRVCQVLGCCSELVSSTRYALGSCNQSSCLKGKDNGVTSSSDGRALQETTLDMPHPPIAPPSMKGHHDSAVWLQPLERESSHDSMVSSTSNLPSSSAAQESDAASVLLYQSCNSGKDPRLWNVQEVTSFMFSIGCSNYADAFVKEEIDGRALLLLTQEMLESLTENKLGPMTKIQSAVKALKQAWGI